MVNQEICKKKVSIISLVMPISDPRDRFFYPHHTLMKDTYNLFSLSTFEYRTTHQLSGALRNRIYL